MAKKDYEIEITVKLSDGYDEVQSETISIHTDEFSNAVSIWTKFAEVMKDYRLENSVSSRES